jgi:hypothetical protein
MPDAANQSKNPLLAAERRPLALKLQMRIEGRDKDQSRIVADPAMPPRVAALQMRGEWAFR